MSETRRGDSRERSSRRENYCPPSVLRLLSELGFFFFSAESFAELMDATRSKNGPHVVANDPDNSLLMWKVAGVDAAGRNVFGDRMPFGRPPLDPSEIALLRSWIEEGAIFSIAPPAIDAIAVTR